VTDVVCVGLATLDTIYRVPSLPERDGRVVASERVVAGGGPAATAAVAAARLGIDVSFVGAVGDDETGARVREGLEQEGVDVSGLRVVRGAGTPQSTILVEADGARAIIHDSGTARLEPVEVDAAWVHVDHVGYAALGRGGARVSIDGGNPIGKLDLAGVFLYAPTAGALERDFGGDARRALDAGAELVIVTRGASGSVAYDGARTIEAPPFRATDLVSTLGAGDVFHGALLAALVEEQPLAEALRFANAAAALSCRALDGRSAIPTREEVEAALA
jgi:sugar/nucleoside kinase (ribokinase family)